MWAMNHLRHPGSMRAALALIESCLHNEEYEDAESYARHAYFMIAEMTDNFIPADKRSLYLADASHWLALAIYALARNGGISSEEKEKVGKEAIELACKALELHTQLYGTENANVASYMCVLANALDYFNNVDNDEVFRLKQQAIAIYRRVEGNTSPNVPVSEQSLAASYTESAKRALASNDLNRQLANLEFSLPHLLEAARLFRAINHVEKADAALRRIAQVEESIRAIKAAATAAKG